jgi:two-component system cell cycle sensor histidine kinase/response regulator CckA
MAAGGRAGDGVGGAGGGAAGRLLAWAGGTAAVAAASAAAVAGFGGHAAAAGAAGLCAVVGTGALLIGTRAPARRGGADGRAEDALDAAFRDDPAGRAVCDADGAVLAANPAALRLVGAARPRDLPDRLAGLLGEGRVALERAARAGRGGRAEADRGGRRLRVAAWPAGDGLVAWRVEDVTDEDAASRARDGRLARLEALVEALPAGVAVVAADGSIDDVNPAMARYLGAEPADLAGRPLTDVAIADAPADGDAASEPAADALLLRADGERLRARAAEAPLPGGGRVALVHDVAPERDWQAALRRSEHRFQRLFDDSPTGIALLDPDDRLVECNRAFLDLLGGVDPVGRALGDLVAAPERAGVAERLAAIRAGGAGRPFEARIGAAADRVAQVHARRLAGAAGGGALVLHAVDLTEQKRLEAQFVQGQKMQAVGQLAGGVAHDFNNLLTAMIGFCDLLLLRHKPGDQSFNDIMQIKQNANRAANLVRQLLAFSRQQTLQPRVLNLTDALADLSNLLRRLIGEHIELRMTHGRDLGLVRVDQGQLDQVIINLAVNARDAMPGGGRLAIRTRNETLAAPERRDAEEIPAGDYVAVEVEDTGVGIPPENLGRIFEPFFSTKEVGSGTGLGLSTVYGIVRQTGGFVLVDSTPGRGTTFTILLPRWRGEDEAPAAAAEASAGDLTGAGTVLLVEDEDAVRVFSARALRNKGYTVLEARSGDAALELLEQAGGRIDLLVSDVVMPAMDGPELMRRVRALLPELPVIFISGYAEERLRRDIDDRADVHFLPKPYNLKQLASKVKEVMRG